MIAEDTEDGADDATVDEDIEAKTAPEEGTKENETVSLSEELAAKIIREKECSSKESKEKERREEKERAAAGDALAALADACGEAEAAKEKEGPVEAVDKEIKQEENEAEGAAVDGADAGEQAGGLFLICEENVLPESPVPHNHGQANHGDNQEGHFLNNHYQNSITL